MAKRLPPRDSKGRFRRRPASYSKRTRVRQNPRRKKK